MASRVRRISKGTTYVFNDSACLACLTETNYLVLIEQFRPVHNRLTIELPGGNVEVGESPEDAALREFTEETGLISSVSKILFTLDLDLSTTIHRTHVFLGAIDASSTGETHRENVRRIRLADAAKMVEANMITHAPTVAAILALRSKLLTGEPSERSVY